MRLSAKTGGCEYTCSMRCLLVSVCLILSFLTGCVSEAPKATSVTAKDPVCGMTIDTKKATATARYKDKTYYFCSSEEKAEFEKNPEKYAKL